MNNRGIVLEELGAAELQRVLGFGEIFLPLYKGDIEPEEGLKRLNRVVLGIGFILPNNGQQRRALDIFEDLFMSNRDDNPPITLGSAVGTIAKLLVKKEKEER